MHVDSETAEHSWHVDNISAGSILSLVLFNIFINSLDNEIVLSIGEGVLGILFPVLHPPVQKRHGHTAESPAEGLAR